MEKKITKPIKYFIANKTQPITQSLLKEKYYYMDGMLYYIDTNKRATSFGGVYYRSYNKVCLMGTLYKNASFIFLFHHGYIPEVIDHIDRDRLNDKIENLRAATISQNNANRTKTKDTLFKYTGVLRHIPKRLYIASLQKNGIVYRSRSYKTIEDAALAYNRLAVMYHGEFANLNIIQPC